MARVNESRSDEEETGTAARCAGMVFADRQAGRRVNKPGQARGHRQEREEGRMAEGQAAQGFVRNLFFRLNRPGGWGIGAEGRYMNPPFCANRFLGKFAR